MCHHRSLVPAEIHARILVRVELPAQSPPRRCLLLPGITNTSLDQERQHSCDPRITTDLVNTPTAATVRFHSALGRPEVLATSPSKIVDDAVVGFGLLQRRAGR